MFSSQQEELKRGGNSSINEGPVLNHNIVDESMDLIKLVHRSLEFDALKKIIFQPYQISL